MLNTVAMADGNVYSFSGFWTCNALRYCFGSLSSYPTINIIMCMSLNSVTVRVCNFPVCFILRFYSRSFCCWKRQQYKYDWFIWQLISHTQLKIDSILNWNWNEIDYKLWIIFFPHHFISFSAISEKKNQYCVFSVPRSISFSGPRPRPRDSLVPLLSSKFEWCQFYEWKTFFCCDSWNEDCFIFVFRDPRSMETLTGSP